MMDIVVRFTDHSGLLLLPIVVTVYFMARSSGLHFSKPHAFIITLNAVLVNTLMDLYHVLTMTVPGPEPYYLIIMYHAAVETTLRGTISDAFILTPLVLLALYQVNRRKKAEEAVVKKVEVKAEEVRAMKTRVNSFMIVVFAVVLLAVLAVFYIFGFQVGESFLIALTLATGVGWIFDSVFSGMLDPITTTRAEDGDD